MTTKPPHRIRGWSISTGLALFFMMPSTFAETVAYPAHGQSVEQQNLDKENCRDWATQQTGIRPEDLNQQAAKNSSASSSGTGAGVAIGTIAGHTPQGAAIAHARKRRKEEQASQNQEAAQAELQKQMELYERAEKVCLSGKGYVVK